MTRFQVLCCAAFISTLGSVSLADTFSVSSKAAFRRTDSGDTSVAARIIDLSALTFSVHDGDTVHLESLGFFKSQTSAADNTNSMGGIFSSSNTLLATSTLNRVPGALQAGVPVFSGNTFFDNLTTDIPEDFVIATGPTVNPIFSSIDIQVPIGAHYLFICANNVYLNDNSDPNGDFAVAITPTPEPGSLLLLGLGGAVLCRRRRERHATR